MTEHGRPEAEPAVDHDEETTSDAPRPAGRFDVMHRLNRRELSFGLGASAVMALAARQLGGRFLGTAEQAGTATASRDASPVASALASPVASPVATPQPVASTGTLQVIRDQRPTDPGPPVVGGHLSLLLDQTDNTDFSPVAYNQSFQIPASYLDPLVWIDEVTMEPRPWLAQSWAWSADGKTITFTLRSDVLWHSGAPLTARDVVFSFFVARDDINSNVRNLFATMDNAFADNDQTARIVLTEPDGSWLFNASNQFIFHRAQYTDYWTSRPEGERTLSGFDWKKSLPDGSGPWKITTIGSSGIDLARNDRYFAGAPSFATMTLGWEADAEKRLDAWKSGKTDLLWPVRAADLASVNTEQGRLYVADAASVMFAAFNFQDPKRDIPDLFNDVRLRQALTLALNRDAYAQAVFGGFVHQDAAGTIAQPWAHDPSVVNPAFDLQQARSLLRQAGWQDRDLDGVVETVDGRPLQLTAIVENDARPELLAVLQHVASDLKALGVPVEVQQLGADQFRDRWVNGHDFDLIAYAYNLYADFTDFDLYGSAWDIRQNPQGWNPGGYHNKDVDAAIQAALVAEDETKQKAALSQLQRLTNQDLFGLWFGFPQDLILVRPDIRGFQPNKLWQTWDTRKLWRAT